MELTGESSGFTPLEATVRPPVRYYSRPKANATEAELKEWAEDFACVILGPQSDRGSDWIDPEGGPDDDDRQANRCLPEAKFNTG